MVTKSIDLILAREVIENVLNQLEVDAYLFEVEPKTGSWELKVECAIDEGWGSFTLDLAEPLPKGEQEEAMLLERMRTALASCKRNQQK